MFITNLINLFVPTPYFYHDNYLVEAAIVKVNSIVSLEEPDSSDQFLGALQNENLSLRAINPESIAYYQSGLAERLRRKREEVVNGLVIVICLPVPLPCLVSLMTCFFVCVCVCVCMCCFTSLDWELPCYAY